MRSKFAVGVLLLFSLGGWTRAQHWERLGPEGGMVVSLGAGSGGDVYLGTADGHVFASQDAAASWELRGRVGTRLDAVVTRLVIDPRDRNRLFAAVWYQEAGAGGGVFESVDGGRSWKLVGLQGETVRALEIAPAHPDELVAGTRSGVFRSLDAGKNWERISPPGDGELRNVDSLAIDPRNPEVIYAGTYHLPWLTRDGGKSWKAVIAGIIDDSDIMSLRLDATNPDRVYMSACSGIYRSDNQGGDWTKLQGIPYSARRTQVIAQDTGSPNMLYAGTTEGLWVTRDGGENWTRATPKNWVVNAAVILAGRNGLPGRVVLGTDGQGAQVSDDAGATITPANRGFKHTVAKQLIADWGKPEHLLMVVERNGFEILESNDEGKSWSLLSLASEERGKPAALKADLVEEAYASPWGWLLRLGNAQLWRWEENKKSWKEWKLALPSAQTVAKTGAAPDRAKSATPRPALKPSGVIAFSQNFALVATNEGLLRCLETGGCSRVKVFGHTGKVRAVWVSATGREIGAVVDAKLGWSPDRGETAAWRDLPVAPQQVCWLDVVDSGAGKTMYLGTGSGLYLSHDAGVLWQRVQSGLPAGQTGRWIRDSRAWVLTERDGGIYVSQDAGATWRRVDQDADRGRATGLAGTKNGAILLGSQNEGLLQLELTEEPKAAQKP